MGDQRANESHIAASKSCDDIGIPTLTMVDAIGHFILSTSAMAVRASLLVGRSSVCLTALEVEYLKSKPEARFASCFAHLQYKVSDFIGSCSTRLTTVPVVVDKIRNLAVYR